MIPITINTRHDFNYWVCECPLLGLVSADLSQDEAEDDMLRMVQAQILYGLQKDPDLMRLTDNRKVAGQILAENSSDTGVVIKCEFFQRAGHRTVTLPKVVAAASQDHGTVEDGWGSAWAKCSPNCSLHVVRPGKVQCNEDCAECPSREETR